MLAIRLQRVGRKSHAMYRLVIQESQRHPSSGRVIAYVGTYDPHSKDAKVQVETAQKYLDNGAQPSPRVVKLLKNAGVKLPKWVIEASDKKAKSIRNSDKLRKNRPAEEPKPEVAEPTETVEPADEPEPELPMEAPESEIVEVDQEPDAAKAKEDVETAEPTAPEPTAEPEK